jgi:glycine betaine/choline ABC-type transport system substrate-binding protein
VNRRGFLTAVGIGGLGVAGAALTSCARVSPVTPAPSPIASLTIGTDGTGPGDTLSAILVAALAAKQQPTTVARQRVDTAVAAVAEGSPAIMSLFGWTALQSRLAEEEPPALEDLITTLATAVAPEVSVLRATQLDGAVRWATTPALAASGVTSLSQVRTKLKGGVVATPSWGMTNTSGVPALEAAYGVSLPTRQIDDAAARRAALDDGSVQLALFRRTDSLELDGLQVLEDPISATLAEQHPRALLALGAAMAALTQETFDDLRGKLAADPQAAVAWVSAAGLG